MENPPGENFKGIYHESKPKKYIDPVTGCHFEYQVLYDKLCKIKQERSSQDRLNSKRLTINEFKAPVGMN